MDKNQLFGSGFEFNLPIWGQSLWAVGLIIVLGMFWIRIGTKQAEQFADEDQVDRVLGKRRRLIGLIRIALLGLGLVLIVGATMRPRNNPHQDTAETKGRDIVFLVDVSRSMLVRDVAPNRLERAKIWIKDLVAELDTDRVGLVAFAGSSSVRSPLTTDRAFFDLALDELSPESVDIGGTNIGDAIRRCMRMVFYDLEDSEKASHRDIILITDGEDQESLPVEAAGSAGEAGVRILALGIGSSTGSTVLDENNQPVTRNGQVIRSRLDSAMLSQIATATTGGAYLEVGTGDIDLAQVYTDFIEQGNRATIGNASITRWDEQYAFMLAPGLILIAFEMILGGFGVRKEVSA